MAEEYTVQFVGLAYFLHQTGSRHVLLPDGRKIPNVTAHEATIAVAADDLADAGSFTGWDEAEIIRTPVNPANSGTNAPRELLQFVLSGDSIEIEGTSRAVEDEPLVTSRHDGVLQPLTRTGKGSRRATISPRTARTVGDVQIRRGELRAFRYPGSDNDGTGAIISQLTVPYDRETITVTVRPRFNGGSTSSSPERGVRTITLRNGGEIAIVNASRPGDSAAEDKTDHFQIYGQLAPGRLALNEPRPTPIDFPLSPSEHLLFRAPGAIGSSVKCNNTCC